MIVHIATTDGLACGTRSHAAAASSEALCRNCRKALKTQLRQAIIAQATYFMSYQSAAMIADRALAAVLGEPGEDGRK